MRKDFGTILKEALTKNNYKQKDIAEKLNISPQTMSHYINNKRLPQLDCFLSMVEFLGLKDVFEDSPPLDKEHMNTFLLTVIPKLDEDQQYILFLLVRYFDKSIHKKKEPNEFLK